MKTTFAAALAAAALLAAASTSSADTRAHHRQIRQQHRIEQGMRSGRLTPRETMRLERGHLAIRRAILRARADGVVTARERARIARMQNMESRRIWRQKHDRQGC
jgi:uncharacterized membrane protein YebE (DUF533 family)